ncbi:TonB-dependent receptor [Methylocystis sp. ATCC 49242]|uniref:TonB-dependent receptor n=1 Tax=Methylocystis sp. ATCC 49242 TaxID=622637 RepID=UPI0001F86838|nr:TonB-dependent receptor [Methylocystis sp. ATCC 49242]
MRIKQSAATSVLALLAAGCFSEAFAHTVSLPTIDVGGHRRMVSVPHEHARAARQPVTAARPSSPIIAAAPAPAPDKNDSFGSSAQQNTALGPRINYPAPPKEMPSSSERFFTGGQVNTIPAFRPGEALEIVPGLAVTQHSGEGKANQYYLRGFDLDHGTDLALYLDSMPLNMRTHGHGQGYADANFVIPEMLAYIDARKGPYNVEDGDFSNAGTIRMQYLQKVPEGVFSSTAGAFGYGRQFGMKSWEYAGGDILGGGEISTYQGPWISPNNARKINTVLRWSRGEENNGMSITGMAYANRWNSTDQIPMRAIDTNQMSRWGTLNPTDGGDTTRFSLSGRWAEETENYRTKVEAFAMHSTLNLYNNFTYYLVNPVLGDQFRQFDRRTMVGGNAYHTRKFTLLDKESELKFGFQSRYDDIRIGLQDTFLRSPYDTIRNDHVSEGNISLLTELKTKWSPWLRTIVGTRWDYFWGSNYGLQTYLQAPIAGIGLDPGANLFQNAFRVWTGPFNNGASNAQLISPKASVVINPWDDKTDFYMNFGRGFHSNDFRATTQRFNASEVTEEFGYVPVQRQGLLSASTGAEIGVKTRAIDKLESAATLFFIRTNQENIFAGDSGNTEIARGANRVGIEFTNHYRPLSWMAFEGDVTATYARFRGYNQDQADLYWALLQPGAFEWGAWAGNAPGNYLVNATPIVATGAIELGEATGWFANAKYRYIAPRALTEDGYFKSPAIGTVNLRVGYRWKEGWKLQLDVFNMFNSRSQQIAYAYGSFLPTDPLFRACNGLSGLPTTPDVCGVGQMGVVGHPVEPPSWRLTFGGPIEFDPSIKKGPDLTEPFQLVKFWE